jgi:transcriptional regulator with XRE-family HTH domain
LVSAVQTKRSLAARLGELRREKEMAQEKLAEAAEMHRTYLAGIERALRNPSLENLVKLANALDITLAELFSPGKSNTSAADEAAPVNSAQAASGPCRR